MTGTTTVDHRTQGTKCPYCSNRRVCLHNSLATVAPEVSKSWNYSKNVSSPEQVLGGSGVEAEWQCPVCKQKWRASINRRVHTGSGCAKCSTRNRTRRSQPTFAEAQPAELAEWDHERNNEDGLYPHKITLCSSKHVHWICLCCPRGQLHRWTATPADRMSNGSGCPCCAGMQACVCNSLESLFPAIAAEFDEDKNGFAPAEIVARSHKQFWWRNAKRGSWRQSVNTCTDRRWLPNAK